MTRTTKDDWSEYERPRITARNAAMEAFWDEHDYDTHACVGCDDADVALEVHHIDGNPYNAALSNLEARCHACHNRAHRREAISGRLDALCEEAGSLGDG